jgi:hypothetical protein
MSNTMHRLFAQMVTLGREIKEKQTVRNCLNKTSKTVTKKCNALQKKAK